MTLFTALSLFFLLLAPSPATIRGVRGSPCIAMDADFNLLVFGFGGKDLNAGTQDTWTGSAPAMDITTTGRPPFDGANTTCYLAQFFNAIYVLNADASDHTSVHIYDVANAAWSTQAVTVDPSTSSSFDPTNFKAVLDHDTNVFYALSNGELFFLDMGALTSANATALTWMDVGRPSFDTTAYQPVMALAQNHVHFLDVPGLQNGQADIFVIHFSFFQPEPQTYPAPDGTLFSQQHGQATSFFRTSGVQTEFAYIPDGGSAAYVLNVETNTTQSLPGPPTKDAGATYFAGVTFLLHLSSAGDISFLPYNPDDAAANAAAQWAKVSAVSRPASGFPTSVSTVAGAGVPTGVPGSGSGNGSGGSGSGGDGAGDSSDAVSWRRINEVVVALGVVALVFVLL